MKRTVLILLGALLASLLTGCGPAQPTAPTEVIIGGIFPLTGGAATFGQSSKEGMQLAVDQFNARGGVTIQGTRRTVRPIFDDTEGQPEKAANVGQKQINHNKVTAIVGPVMSKNALAVAPIANAAGLPMVSSAATNPQVTQVGPYVFRACFIDPFQGTVMARYAYETLGARKAAVLFDNGNDYNKGLAEFFRTSFTELGGEIVAWEAFTDEDKTVEFRSQLANMKAAEPDFLYLPNYYQATALILKQAREMGLDAPAGGGDGWDSPKLVEIGGEAVEGGMFSNHFSKEDPRPEVQRFVATYRETYGKDPDALGILAYDATVMLLTALESAGSTDGKALRTALVGSTFQAVSGEIRFDERRNPIKSAVILKIQDGAQSYVTTVTP